MVYVRNLHDAFAALHDAVTRAVPEVTAFDKEEMQKIRPNPVQQSQIQQIDVLLRELKISQ
jgi:hypothetical protein